MTTFRRRIIDTREVTIPQYAGYYCLKIGAGADVCNAGSDGTPVTTGRFREMYDVPTPRFRTLVKKQDVSQPASWYDQRISAVSGQTSWYISGNGRISRGVLTGCCAGYCPKEIVVLPTFLSTDESNARSALLTSALADANSSEFQGQTFAAEAIKTVQMLGSPFKSLRSLTMKMVRHRDDLVRKGLSSAEASASAWLEYRYGWRPLLMDCADLFKVLSGQGRVPGVVLRKRHRQSFDWSGSSSADVFNNTYQRVRGEHKLSYRSTVHAGARYKITDPRYEQFLSTSLGLSLDFVPSTVWELVPFSFVADWFVNVGDWIRSVVPNPHIQILSNFTSVSRVRTSSMKYFHYSSYKQVGGDPNAWVACGYGGSYDTVTSSGDRAVNVAVPTHPVLVPGSLSLLRKLDAFSLVHQFITGHLKSFRHL